MTRLTLATANTPGAVAILQLQGESVADVLKKLTGRDDWPDRRALLCDFAGIDEGLAVLISRDSAQLMPHGGPRVVQRLTEHLIGELGCTYDPAPDPQTLYPEASSPIEADMLAAIARAASPAAIDLLANQPQQWASLLQQDGELDAAQRQAILERSRTLDQLVTPPTVVVVGPANVGKSTLTNALMGKTVSITADLPGTTRDWVGGLVELSGEFGLRGLDLGEGQQGIDPSHPNPQPPTPNPQIAVNWLDTPGLRDSDDRVEQRAIALAKKQIERADVLIAMRDHDQDWPAEDALPRTPDLWVVNKSDDAGKPTDDAGRSPDNPLRISALHGQGLDALQAGVIQSLGLHAIRQNEPWAFCERLKRYCETGDAHAAAGQRPEGRSG